MMAETENSVHDKTTTFQVAQELQQQFGVCVVVKADDAVRDDASFCALLCLFDDLIMDVVS